MYWNTPNNEPTVFCSTFSNLIHAVNNAKDDAELLVAAQNLQKGIHEIREVQGEYPRMFKPNERELANLIADGMTMGFEYKQFNEAMERQHNTHQQSFGSLIMMHIKHTAERESYGNGVDGRNEFWVRMCKRIVRLLETEDVYVGKLPTI